MLANHHPIVYLIATVSLAAFMLCGLDKRFAVLQQRRVPEMVLLLVALAGGSLGLLLGMHLFRHKTRKVSFQVIVVLITLLQLFLLEYFMT